MAVILVLLDFELVVSDNSNDFDELIYVKSPLLCKLTSLNYEDEFMPWNLNDIQQIIHKTKIRTRNLGQGRSQGISGLLKSQEILKIIKEKVQRTSDPNNNGKILNRVSFFGISLFTLFTGKCFLY